MDENRSTSVSRRHFLQDCGVGLGKVALAGLLTDGLRAGTSPAASGFSELGRPLPHHRPRAKAVIHLFMAGAPSQLDLFDPKPELAKHAGKPLPPSIIGDQRYAFIQPDAAVLGPQFAFRKCGASGADLGSPLRHLEKVVDDLCIVRSMHTDQFNHAPGQLLLQTGFAQPGRPCLGSWATYGLGAETEDLPAFVVMSTSAGLSGGSALWSNGFLPPTLAGVRLRRGKNPILNVASPPGVPAGVQADSYRLLAELNRERLEVLGDPQIEARIAAFEMASRMQVSAPELMDLSDESPETLALYGADPARPSFGRACLLARRMVERGVRFINIFHGGWDAHSAVKNVVSRKCKETDQGCAALVADLKRRGLLDETLVIWGGEFGRTPMVETNQALGRKLGRDHHPQAFTTWMAGGGVRGGQTYGQTDDFGFHIVENPVHVHDLQATVLHLLGFDHERLTYRHAGRDFRLTDVHGKVVPALLS